MEQFIAGILISLGIGIARRWSHWSKVERVAEAIVEDPTNPITNPREALEQAVILINQRQIEAVAPTLGKRLELAEMRAERARQDEAADPHDVELLERDGTEVFSPGWDDKTRGGGS